MAPSVDPPSDRFDGHRLKALTGDATKFKQYADSKFQKLGGSATGGLSAEQLQPAIAEWGELLGLPPMGTSADTDEIYKEITGQYLDASKRSGMVDRETFEVVTRDILLGISDSLEANPISVDTIDGSQLRHILAPEQKAEFQLMADRAYEAINTQVIDQRSVSDAGSKDQAPAASESAMGGNLEMGGAQALALALKQHLTIEEGVPPANSHKVEALIDRAIQSVAGEKQQGQRLSKEEFSDHLRLALERLAQGLRAEPVTVAHTEKEVKGEHIKPMMEDKDGFARAVHQIFEEHSQNGKFPRADFWTAFDRVAGNAGLPPLGASEKMDKVYDTVIGTREAAPGAYNSEEELAKHLEEALFLVGARLTAEPVSLRVAQVVGDPNDVSSQSSQREQQVGVPTEGQTYGGERPVESVPSEGKIYGNQRTVEGIPSEGEGQIYGGQRPVESVPSEGQIYGAPRVVGGMPIEYRGQRTVESISSEGEVYGGQRPVESIPSDVEQRQMDEFQMQRGPAMVGARGVPAVQQTTYQ